jgi:glucose-1-phosphate cytidylyltransferase
LRDESEFLANYSDGLTDLPLPSQLDHFRAHGAIASFVSVKPAISYHLVSNEPDGVVTAIQDIADSPIRINGGYFVFKREIFNYIRAGEELVHEPFYRLTATRKLLAFEYNGFWRSMDTFKDRTQLEDIYSKGGAPWEVWNTGNSNRAPGGELAALGANAVSDDSLP